MAKTSYTTSITLAQAHRLRGVLEERGFEFSDRPYALFSAKKGKAGVTVYEKGPKILVQGKETEDFVRFVLEPEILGKAELGYEEENNPAMFEPHIGVDESGKGDFFGPLVIAGVYTNRESARALLDLGVADSKKISDGKILKLAPQIRSMADVSAEVISLRPEKYNELYDSFGNLNRLLAWGHARVISSLAEKRQDCMRALSDQFARKEVLESALSRQEGLPAGFVLEQKTKGESDVAVAAASILAREAFIDWVARAERGGGIELPLGAGPHVIDAARSAIEKYGVEILPKLAKMHFKTAAQV